jgi:PAS domain S-box-containing protein
MGYMNKSLFEGRKLYAAIIACALVTFFITFSVIDNHYQYILTDTISENKATAKLLSSLVYEHQNAAIGILESYAQRPLFIDAVKKKDFENVVPHLQTLNKNYTEMDALFITDRNGTLWANYPVDSKGFGKNLAHRDWYKGLSKDWKPYISSLYQLIVLEEGLAVAVSVPVIDRSGNVIGTLSGAQRTPFLAAFIKANIIDPERQIALLDQEGNIIFSNAVPYEEKVTKYPDGHVLEKALSGTAADLDIADAKKRSGVVYISIAPVKGLGWSVIVGKEKDAIVKSLYDYFILSTVTGLVIFILMTGGLLYFRREYTYRKTKELLEAEQKYRSIIENSAEGIFQTTPEGRYMSVNPALARIFGYDSSEEMINYVVDVERQVYANPDQRKEYLRLLDEKGTVEDYELQMHRKDGSIVWISANTRAVRNDAGNLLYYEGFVTDITDRKEAEAALKEHMAKLEEINRELESFSYSISHDLRSPLRAIDGYARMLLRKHAHEFDEDSMRKFNYLRSNAQMMGKLIDDILTLSRLGRAKMSIIELDMDGIIRDVWKELQTINPERDMNLTIQPMPAGYGDRTLIKQVYANLLANAVKFTKYKNPAQIEAGGYTDGDSHIYFIKDNGVGFDMAYYDKLFGIFHRLHSSPDFEGTGVGLATIQRIILRHDGRVWAEGKVDEGATFYFTLPLSHTQ